MTIAIGFLCNQGIVLASDSQMSIGGKQKRYGEKKLFRVPVRSPHSAGAIAISGSLDGASYFREILLRRVRETEVKTERDIPNALEAAMKETLAKILEPYASFTAEERRAQIEAHDFSVLLAHTFNQSKFIYTASLWSGLAVRSHRTFEAIGCGQDIASFILTGCNLRQATMTEALGIAVYAVEMCKKFDQACGGDVQHLLMLPEMNYMPIFLADQTIGAYAEAVRRTEGDFLTTITGVITKHLQDVTRQISEQEGQDPFDDEEEAPWGVPTQPTAPTPLPEQPKDPSA